MNASKANRTPPTYEADLRPVSRQLAQWRASRVGKQIPESIWTAIAKLGQEYGISPVSQALNVNYTTLKGRVESLAADPFVEMEMPIIPAEGEWMLEIDHGQAIKLTVRLPRTHREDLLWLIQSLGRQAQ